MKIFPIKNEFQDILAIRIEEYDFNTEDISEIISLIREYGIVIYKKTKLSIEDYNKWQLKLGYHQYAGIWCSHEQYPIFFRVTNGYVKKDQKGLFEDQELDWHCDILFTPDSEELLGLYGKTIPRKSKTLFANSVPYWKNLDKKTREVFSGLRVEITNKIEDTYEKTLAHYDLPEYQLKDFNKQRVASDIRKSVNFEEKYIGLYKPPRCLKHNVLRLIPKHPLGAMGVYFPHLNISSIVDSFGKQISNHREIYDTIKKEYILSGRYIYEHDWDEGDIVLADQLTGVHKRNNVWKDDSTSLRELLRSACWYKTKERIHFERAV